MALSEKARRGIAALDVRLDTALPFHRFKVPAQEGVFSLIIGAGGTGIDGLLETKGLLNRRCCLDENHRDQPTAQVAYLGIDADEWVRGKTSTDRTGRVSLDAERELVILSNPDIVKFWAPPFGHLVPPYISSWLDSGVAVSDGTRGTSGIRQCGRLLLFRNVEKVIGTIQEKVQRMIANQNVSHMNIYILAGIGGGTGGGTFLDLAYIARNVVSHLVGNGKTRVYGYLFMPDVNLSRPMSRSNQIYIQRNSYAALKELDYLMTMSKDGGRFTQQYTPNYVIDTQRPPFDFVHLVSRQKKNEPAPEKPYEYCMEVAARSIFLDVEREVHIGAPYRYRFAVLAQYDQVKMATAQFTGPYPERSNIYLVPDIYEYTLPQDKILRYVASLLFEKMDGMFDREPSQKDVDQARRVLGLTPGALIPMLVGNKCDLANGVDLKWEDLFGKNPKYNYQAKCQKWINDIAVQIHKRAEDFVRDFPARFKQNCEAWFTDGTRGPVWVNHLIVNDKENGSGLVACLRRDAQTASSRVVVLRKQMGMAQEYVAACERDARNAGALFGNREGKTKAYIDAMNAYGDVCAELVATQELRNAKETANIFGTCTQVMTEQNNKLFNVVTEVLMALKKVCKDNANLLTNAWLDDSGHNFTWQPLSIPDVSPTIKNAFGASGTAQYTIAKFSKALLEDARQWSENGVDVKSFICKYLDDNLSSIVNCSLETYVKDALQGADLQHSVTEILAPKIDRIAVPLMALSDENNVGPTYTVINVPYNCPNIKRALDNYYQNMSDREVEIRYSVDTSGIFVRSLLTCVPLSAYAPLATYEKSYLEPMIDPRMDPGLHLYKNWMDLPSPIPARSRSESEGYPEVIKQVEDRQRKLYRECRKLPILLREDSIAHTVYSLRLAELPDLDALFPAEQLRGQRDRLEEAICQIDHWMREGLPAHESTGADDPEIYQVAMVGAADSETVAQECFLGEYDNLCRAEQELEKYHALAKKRQELEQLARA